jgi:hypothetical protein
MVNPLTATGKSNMIRFYLNSQTHRNPHTGTHTHTHTYIYIYIYIVSHTQNT